MSKTSQAGRKAKNIFRKELEKRAKEAINEHLDREHRTLREAYHNYLDPEWEAYKSEQEWEEARRIMDDDYYGLDNLDDWDLGNSCYDDGLYDDIYTADLNYEDHNESYGLLDDDNDYDPDPFYDSPNFFNSIYSHKPGSYYTDGTSSYLCVFLDTRIRYVNVHTGLEYTGFTHCLKEIHATS